MIHVMTVEINMTVEDKTLTYLDAYFSDYYRHGEKCYLNDNSRPSYHPTIKDMMLSALYYRNWSYPPNRSFDSIVILIESYDNDTSESPVGTKMIKIDPMKRSIMSVHRV